MSVSVVIPVKNEEETLESLYQNVSEVVEALGLGFEVIFVDDGSTDRSFEVMQRLHERHQTHVTVLQFTHNFGKAAGLQAGFNRAQGDVVITMDADLQDDPKEIPAFLAALNDGYDLVSGWKENRQDPLGKTLPSKLFNLVMSSVSGVKLHDFNCGFKAYRREVLDYIQIYGELHRFIPALAAWKGFRIGEVAVEHHPRIHGKSKYGIERVAKGFFDFLTVWITRKYSERPLHVFGGIGVFLGLTGFIALTYLTILWFLGESIGGRPLLVFGMLSVLFGMQLVSIGLLGEMLAKLQHQRSVEFVIKRQLEAVPQNLTGQLESD